MSTHGCFTIIINEQKNRVLLVKRKDFPVWDLPGGRLEVGESFIDCVIRETIEETGYIVDTYKKIGEYHRPQFSDIQHVYLGKIIGGQEIKDGDETDKIKWFKFNALPLLMVPHRRMQIKDYVLGKYNTVRTINDSVVLLMFIKIIRKR